MKIIGKLLIKTKDWKQINFVVFDTGHFRKPHYKVIISGRNDDNLNQDYPLGEMLRLVNSETGEEGEIRYNDLPKKIMDKANKELVLLGLNN